MAQSGRAMEPVIPCQAGQKELSDIMLMMEKYFMLKTQTREKKSKVIFHELSLQQVRRLDGFEPDVGGRQRQEFWVYIMQLCNAFEWCAGKYLTNFLFIHMSPYTKKIQVTCGIFQSYERP